MKPVLSPLFLSFVLCFLHCFNVWPEKVLTATEITVRSVKIKDKVWPEVHAKALIKAHPLTSVAIFAAYDYQKNYIPKLIKSEVSSEKVTKTSNATEVSYSMDMPWPLDDSEYIHGHKLERVESGYKVRWYMVKSNVAQDVRGHAIFEPHPQNPNYTLLTYVSLISPNSFFAGIFKKVMVSDLIKSIEAIRDTTEELLEKNPQLIKKYQDKIKVVLEGNPAYLR